MRSARRLPGHTSPPALPCLRRSLAPARWRPVTGRASAGSRTPAPPPRLGRRGGSPRTAAPGPLAWIRSAGWAVIVLPPVRGFRALLSIWRACGHRCSAGVARISSATCPDSGILPAFAGRAPVGTAKPSPQPTARIVQPADIRIVAPGQGDILRSRRSAHPVVLDRKVEFQFAVWPYASPPISVSPSR
jgi:hypothetical protein